MTWIIASKIAQYEFQTGIDVASEMRRMGKVTVQWKGDDILTRASMIGLWTAKRCAIFIHFHLMMIYFKSGNAEGNPLDTNRHTHKQRADCYHWKKYNDDNSSFVVKLF